MPAAKPAAKPATTPKTPRDSIREGLETVVFVVVLVFLLKQFVVEAFVIPTGSMAETLYGYQKVITCPECKYDFPVNASCEAEPQNGQPRRPVRGYCCPNCRFKHAFTANEPPVYYGSGDRVLVHKAMQHIDAPAPGDVVVFKYPRGPQQEFSAQNYIKRLWGVGGDTIAIYRGDLYVCKNLEYPAGDDSFLLPETEKDAWDLRFTRHNAEAARKKFDESKAAGFPAGKNGFELIRKSDAVALAMRRIVSDNDKQSAYLSAKGVRPRWTARTADVTSNEPKMPKVFTHAGPALGWVRYEHIPVGDWGTLTGPALPPVRPTVVDNFMGYNAETDADGNFVLDPSLAEDHKFWVGDLILECRVKITDPAAEVVLELSKGPNRFQAKFAGGNLELLRTGPGGGVLGTWPTRVNGPGEYDIRFGNVDCRLRVWVNRSAVALGAAADYAPAVPDGFDAKDEKREGWTEANDVAEPAGVGATGGVTVSRLKLWRDSYFINDSYRSTSHAANTVHTYYIQPNHYLCLGDNSAQSSDGRSWGVVPERLLLGRAVFVFFPLDRIGFIK